MRTDRVCYRENKNRMGSEVNCHVAAAARTVKSKSNIHSGNNLLRFALGDAMPRTLRQRATNPQFTQETPRHLKSGRPRHRPFRNPDLVLAFRVLCQGSCELCSTWEGPPSRLLSRR